MTLEETYFIGQTVAAVASILSLVYAGLRVKQITIIMRATAR